MSYVKIALGIFILNSLIHAQAADFAWLVGKWKMESERAEIYEEWTQDSNRLTAEGYYLNKGKKIVTENLFLDQFKDQWAFIAMPNKQPIALFALVSSDSNRFIFENKEHDFPQRIIYDYDGKSVINASIEGTQNSQPKSINFKLIRTE